MLWPMLELIGTENITIEWTGSLDRVTAASLVGELKLEVDGADRIPVSLLIFQMKGLHLRGLPFPSFHYGEALWRIGVIHEGVPSWFACACDLDSRWIRWGGARWVHYPVRRAQFHFSQASASTVVEVRGHDCGMTVHATPAEFTPPAEPPRPLFVRTATRCYRIPWREDPAPLRNAAQLEWENQALAVATFGANVRWDSLGLLHRGRIHRCGLSVPIKVPR